MAADKSEEEEEDRDARGKSARGARDSGDADTDEEDDGEDEENKKPSIFSKTWFKIAVAAAIVIIAIIGFLWWLNARRYESTDDAFLSTHIVLIAPQVAGQVARVYVRDNQVVHRGQPLVEIDSAAADTKLQQAEAQAAQAQMQYRAALANARGAQAQAENTARDLARYRLLARIAPRAVAPQQIDQAIAAAKNAKAQRDSARAQIKAAQAQIKLDKALIAGARLTLGYTHIAAPVDGTVAQRSVAAGNYVSPGQQLMAIVPFRLWVTANFKETQLQHMRVGQGAAISVDSCDKTVKGHVDSIQRGAGQAFGILPPENATGNYVKVVQRVPVKIVLDRIPKDCHLGPGMSVEPRVKVR